MKYLQLLFFILIISNLSYSQWVNVSPGGNDTIMYRVDVINANTVYVVRGFKGSIVRTTNGGSNWALVNSPTNLGINKIHFINQSTGFLGGVTGIYKTTNACASWVQLSTVPSGDMFFLSEQLWYSIEPSPARIYKTTNGGINFSFVSIFENYSLNIITGSDSQNMYVMGNYFAEDSTAVFKYIGSDTVWSNVLRVKGTYNDMSFCNSSTGIVCGNNGKILRTTNGAVSWDSSVVSGNALLGVQMNNLTNGYIVGTMGTILKTTNSGTSWSLQNSPVASLLNDVYVMSADDLGFIVGGSGRILKTTNGGITAITMLSEVPREYSLSQNYPNPFNPNTTIKFSMSEQDFVNLEVFDITGKRIRVILNRILRGGIYKINFDASNLPSGTYFYRFKTSTFFDVRKMVLVK